MNSWSKRIWIASLLFIVAVLFPAAPDACSWDYVIWQKSKKSDTPLFRFVTKEWLAGYIDKEGKIVIPPKYRYWGNSGGDFFDGRAIVKNEKDGEIIDATGKKIADVDELRTGDFSERVATVTVERSRESGFKRGFIGLDGKIAIPAQFDSVRSFSDGLAVAVINDRYGYIEHSGKFVIQPQFAKAWDFSEGFARVFSKEGCYYETGGPCSDIVTLPRKLRQVDNVRSGLPRCEYSFVDKQGQFLSDKTFKDAKDFSEGLAPVWDGEHWGFIDRTGGLKIPFKFKNAEPFSEGLARVLVGDLWGYINASGQFVIAPQFKFAGEFSEGLAVVGKFENNRHQYWFVDKAAKQAIPGLFDAASAFVMERAHVRVGRKESYIDRTGKAVFTYSLPGDDEEK